MGTASSAPSELGESVELRAIGSSTDFKGAFTNETEVDKFGVIVRRRKPVNMADISVDSVTQVDYDFDWNSQYYSKNSNTDDLLKRYLQSYDVGTLLEDNLSDTGSTPSLVSDDNTSPSLISDDSSSNFAGDTYPDIYRVSSDAFDDIWN